MQTSLTPSLNTLKKRLSWSLFFRIPEGFNHFYTSEPGAEDCESLGFECFVSGGWWKPVSNGFSWLSLLQSQPKVGSQWEKLSGRCDSPDSLRGSRFSSKPTRSCLKWPCFHQMNVRITQCTSTSSLRRGQHHRCAQMGRNWQILIWGTQYLKCKN